MKTEPNEPINPCTLHDINGGLTKREYFAAQALTGMLANEINGNKLSESASRALWVADELIKELNSK